MKRIEWALIVILALTFASCRHAANKPDAADFIYFGGDIITMEGDSAQYAEAIAVKNGKMVFVGSKEAAENMKGDSTVLNDLQGRTLVPGFVDGHAHFAGFGAQ